MEIVKTANDCYVLAEGETLISCQTLDELFKELRILFDEPLPSIKKDKDLSKSDDGEDL